MLTSLSINAQNIRFGVKGGLNLSSLNGDNSLDYWSGFKYKTGFHIGGIVEFKLSDKISIQPELLFSSQGYKSDVNIDFYFEQYPDYDESLSASQIDEKVTFNYLNLPIMGKLHFSEKFNLEFGPQIGFLMSAKTIAKDNLGEELKSDIKDSKSKIDLGLNLGVGYTFKNSIFLNIRYNLGLTDVNDFDDEFSEFIEVNKNSVFSLSLGYFFN